MKQSRLFDINIWSHPDMRVIIPNIGKYISRYVDLSTITQHVSQYGRMSVSICEMNRSI
jgi:hypothetical protein